jgi:hypothetical protein
MDCRGSPLRTQSGEDTILPAAGLDPLNR